MLDPLAHSAPHALRAARYDAILARIESLLDGETDTIAALATVATELHHGFEAFHWTGFYRVVAPGVLAVGPYQGGHGCLRIPFDRGVCGAAARTRQTQRVADVQAFPGHIACSSTTRSEIVVPVVGDVVLGVLDVDSDHPDAFDALDQAVLEGLARDLAARFPEPAGWGFR